MTIHEEIGRQPGIRPTAVARMASTPTPTASHAVRQGRSIGDVAATEDRS